MYEDQLSFLGFDLFLGSMVVFLAGAFEAGFFSALAIFEYVLVKYVLEKFDKYSMDLQ